MRSTILPLLAAFGLIAAVPVHAEPRTLSFGMFSSGSSITNTTILQPWLKTLHDQVGDEIQVKVHAGGTLGRNPRQQYKLVKDGVADFAFFVPDYSPGQFPEIEVFSLPGQAGSAVEGSTAIWRMYKQGLLRGFDDVKVLTLWTTGPHILSTVDPITTFSDVKGKRLRVVGPIQRQIAELLGGVPVGLAVTQIAEGLSRGLIQGAIADWNAVIGFRIDEVAKYHYEAHFGVLPLGFIMNKQVYESLSPKARAAIDAGGDILSKTAGEEFDKKVRLFKDREAGKGDHKFLEPSKSELQSLYGTLEPVSKSWIGKNGAEQFNAYKSILQELRK